MQSSTPCPYHHSAQTLHLTTTMKKPRRHSRQLLLPVVMTPGSQRRTHTNRVAGASGVCAWDHQVSSILYKELGQQIPRQFLLGMEYFGSGFLIPIALILWLLPLHLIGNRFRAFCINLFLGFFMDLAIVGILKGAVRRPRPNYNDEGDFILVASVDRYSFPSGHASRSVFVATLVTVWKLGPWWVHFLVWWAAVATAMSRVLMGRHYFLDIAAGVWVGFLNALLMTKGTLQVGGSWISISRSKNILSQVLLGSLLAD